MNKFVNGYDYGISVLGVAFSLDNLETILGIILLVLSIINILYKVVLAIVKHYKNKEYDKIVDDLDNAIEQLDNIKNNRKGDKDGSSL